MQAVRFTSMVLVGVSLLGGDVLAQAAHGGPAGRWGGPGGMGPGRAQAGAGERPELALRLLDALTQDRELAEQVGIDEGQVETLRKAAFEHRREMIRLRGEHELAALKQAELMAADSPDEAAIMQAIEDAGRVRTEIAKYTARQLLTIRQTLSREQQNRLREVVRDRMRERGRDWEQRRQDWQRRREPGVEGWRRERWGREREHAPRERPPEGE